MNVAIQETHSTRQAGASVPKTTLSDAGRIAVILIVVVLEGIALFSVPGLTTNGAFGIVAASYAAGILVLAA